MMDQFHWPNDEGPGPMTKAKNVTTWVLIVLAFLAFICCLAEKHANGAEREPSTGLVKITQETPGLGGTMLSIGSGICVSPDGWIVTAEHVVSGDDKCRVTFDGARNSQTAAVVRRDRRSDIAVLKIEVDGECPCVPVAESSPAKGSRVYSEGYPAGQYARMEGSIREVKSANYGPVGVLFNQRSTVQMIETTHRLQQGNSGGPLYNQDGEVIGIASTVPQGEQNVSSNFIGTQEIQIALTQCGAKGWKRQSKRASKLLPKAYVIGSKDCGACNAFKSDYGSKKRAGARPDLTAYLNTHWRVRYVDKKNASKIIDKYRLKGELPVFMAANIPAGVLYGYHGADDLMKTLDQVITQAPQTDQIEFQCGPDNGVECDMNGDTWFDTDEFMEGEGLVQTDPAPPSIQRTPSRTPRAPQSAPPMRPAPKPAPPEDELQGTPMNSPAEEPTPAPSQGDLSEVTAVILVKKTLSGISGKAVGYLEEHASGAITNKIDEALGGKATVKIVFERTDPAKYAAILDAIGGHEFEHGYILLLAPKKFEGVAASLVSVVESKVHELKHKIAKDLPVEAVFERTEEDSYTAIVNAIGTETEPSGGNTSNWLLALLAALGISDGGLSALFSRFFGKKGTQV